MLTRFRFKRDFRVITRCLSDKPSKNDGKAPEINTKRDNAEKKTSDSNVEKIQSLLKSMLAKPKISESEYRAKFATAPDLSRTRKQKSDEIEVKTENIEEKITKAVGEVAQAIGGDIKQTEAELLSKVLGKINQTSTSLSDLITGMKVDRTKESENIMKMETRGQKVKRIMDKTKIETQKTRYNQRKTKQQQNEERMKKSLPSTTTVDLFNAEPLGIFKNREPNYGTKLDVWENQKQRELLLATSQPPANYFQKMILWTEQGKVWKFPINNEQGLEEEENVHFSEHIFLDAHLEGWCPKKGPIRHFMELVCIGLSKNAFYTAQEKKDHIMWYKEYFESKKDLLNEVGAWDNIKPEKTEAST